MALTERHLVRIYLRLVSMTHEHASESHHTDTRQTVTHINETHAPARPRWGWTIPLAGFSVVLIALVSLLVDKVHPWFQPLDDAIRAKVGVGPDSSSYQWFWPWTLQHVGDTLGAIVVALIVVMVQVVFKRWRHAIYLALALGLGAGLVTQIIKKSVTRARPSADEAQGLYASLFHVDLGSFPSGHSAAAGVFAVAIFFVIPQTMKRLRTAWIVFAVIYVASMMWQRILTNAHWFSDTVSGVCLGASAALILWWALMPWLHHDNTQPKNATKGIVEKLEGHNVETRD